MIRHFNFLFVVDSQPAFSIYTGLTESLKPRAGILASTCIRFSNRFDKDSFPASTCSEHLQRALAGYLGVCGSMIQVCGYLGVLHIVRFRNVSRGVI